MRKQINKKEEILKNIDESLEQLIDDYQREYLEKNRKITRRKRQELVKKCRDKIIDVVLK